MDDRGLHDWYPVATGQAPLHLARIICQRTNLRYDSQLRRSYGTIVVSIASAILLLLFLGGFVQDLKLSDWVLTMAPSSPILTWATREYYRQNDTADSLEEHLRAAKALWARALAGECDADHCLARSREFQNAIYYRRASSPLIVPLLYRFKRLQLEDDMNEAAANFLTDYHNANAGTE